MTDPDPADHITINQADLIRLAEVFEQNRELVNMPGEMRAGWLLACEGMREMAKHMPTGVLVSIDADAL